MYFMLLRTVCEKNCSLFLERITAANLQTMVAIPGQSVVPG